MFSQLSSLLLDAKRSEESVLIRKMVSLFTRLWDAVKYENTSSHFFRVLSAGTEGCVLYCKVRTENNVALPATQSVDIFLHCGSKLDTREISHINATPTPRGLNSEV